MATVLDITTLSINPKEPNSFGEFIVEQVLEQPMLKEVVTVRQGVQMAENIYKLSQLGLSGIADNACARPEGGSKATITEKTRNPKNIGDTFYNCQAEMDNLFKAYYTKIKSYNEKFDIAGSDEEKTIVALVENAAYQAILRHGWLGDTAIAAADAATAGLKVAGNAKFFNVINGIWKDIFVGVSGGTIEKVAIAENALLTIAAQTTLAADRAEAIFEAMWDLANPILKADTTAQLLVSGELFENYRRTLKKAGANFNIDIAQNGLETLMFNGKKVINMSTVWDIVNRAYLVDNTTNNAYYLANRAVLCSASNLDFSTLSENDLTSIESFYLQKERQNATAYGFTLDANIIDNDLIVVAY